MKKLLVAMMLMISSSFALAQLPELNERDSKDLYMALSKWGTRFVDQEQRLIRIEVGDTRCLWQNHDQKPHGGCTLIDLLHRRELSDAGNKAWMLTKTLKRTIGSLCENGNCLTGSRLIRCWHPWSPKNPPVLIPAGRRFICWYEPIRTPEAN